MQEDDVRVICDEVTDAQDLRAPTMQECVPEAVFSATASSTDCSPCIVNSTKQHLDMRIESKTALWNMSVEYCKSIVTVKRSFTSSCARKSLCCKNTCTRAVYLYLCD